jgi:YD repeat-containing protein
MTTQVMRSIQRIGIVMLASVLAAMPATVDSASATYQYDTKGRVSSITYDDGTVVNYTYDLNGNRSGGTRTTPPPDTTPPSAPGTPSFSNITMTSATASWTAATDNKGVTGYDYRVNSGAWQPLSNVLTVNITGLTAVTTYTVSVRARDAASNLGPASSNSFTTPDTQAPSVPTGLGGSAPNSSTVNLSWNASTDNVAVTGYRVYRNGSHIGNSATTSYSDGGRTGSTTYSYQVAAYDAVPNVSAASSAINVTTPDTIAPSTPTSLSATGMGPSQINLSWGASTDTGGSGLAGYRVYRNGSHIASPSTNSYSDTGLATSTSYSYTVAAYDNATNPSGQSNTASATTLTPVSVSLSTTLWRWRKRGANPTNIDPPAVCTGSGGTGTGFTYSWQYVSGDTQISANNPTSSSTDFSRSMPDINTYTAIWRCVATDSNGNSGQSNLTVTFVRQDGIG